MTLVKIVEHNNLLLYNKSYSIDFIEQTIKKKSLDGLSIFDHLDPLISLDFLEKCSFLTQLEIKCIHDHDYFFLKNLMKLERLHIGGSVTNKNEINLTNQTNLRSLSVAWRKNINGIEYCKLLENICLVDFKERDLKFIEKLNSLKEVIIKTASIKNLNGLEKLKSLEHLLLGNCRYLKSINSLNNLKMLKELILDVCSGIEDFQCLSDLPALEELRLMSCNKINTIRFINNFHSLKKLIIAGNTDILDGDLTPVLNVKEIFYANRKHYNIKYPPSNLRKF